MGFLVFFSFVCLKAGEETWKLLKGKQRNHETKITQSVLWVGRSKFLLFGRMGRQLACGISKCHVVMKALLLGTELTC